MTKNKKTSNINNARVFGVVVLMLAVLASVIVLRIINTAVKQGKAYPVASCEEFNKIQIVLPSPTPIVEVCDKYLDIALSIDRSSSMVNGKEFDGRYKLDWAKQAAKTMVQTIQDSGYSKVRFSVSSFGDKGVNSTTHINLTNNYDAVKSAIGSVNYAQAYTCVMCGIKLSNATLTTNNTIDRYKSVVLLSDGMANRVWDGSMTNAKQVAINEANTGRNAGFEYYSIGYGVGTSNTGIDEVTLKAIAGPSDHYQYRPDVQTWTTAFLNVIPKMCTQAEIMGIN